MKITELTDEQFRTWVDAYVRHGEEDRSPRGYCCIDDNFDPVEFLIRAGRINAECERRGWADRIVVSNKTKVEAVREYKRDGTYSWDVEETHEQLLALIEAVPAGG